MKRTLMFCLSLMLALNLHAQNKFIVVAEGQPLIYAMKMLSAQCDYNFVYNNDIIDTSKKIDVDITSDRLPEVLDAIFKPYGISYTIVGKQIALSVPVPSAVHDNTGSGKRKISGTVSDASGDALAAADIYLKDTNKGVFADMNGRYSIEVPDDENTELVFRFIGMREQTVKIGKKSVINVVLEEEAHTLERIVVTGYQTISRERSAGAFTNVSGAEVRDQATVHGSLLRSLEGSATGLSVTQTGDGVQYLIRGVSSINSKTEPLYIVDGVSMTKAQMDRMVNPNDVESINFLKDATAASIWGAQAANGVIVVTTRTGSAGKKLSISYNAGFTFKGKPNYKYQDMMTSREFIDAAISAFDPQTYKWTDINKSTYGLSRGDYRVVLPHEVPMYKYFNGEISLAQRDAILNDLASKDGRKEYEKYFMSNAFLHNQSLSFSGGNDKSTFYASLEYQRDKGSYRDYNDDYRFFFRDVLNVAKWLNLDLSISAYHSKSLSYSSPQISDIPYVTYFDND
ncbi:MAG: carboxypeptidase-like regulatory domain-containing protein, partial [Candidatus Cryptobacteroides sp.]